MILIAGQIAFWKYNYGVIYELLKKLHKKKPLMASAKVVLFLWGFKVGCLLHNAHISFKVFTAIEGKEERATHYTCDNSASIYFSEMVHF